MKYILLVSTLFLSIIATAQKIKPTSFNISYFGETITHPGTKLGATFNLKTWNRNTIALTPTVGFFYHKNYQTGLFVLPELSFKRYNKKGNYKAAGIGAGYMRSFIPNVYKIKNGEIKHISAGHNYFLSSAFFTFGTNVKAFNTSNIYLYVKPQVLYALASQMNSTVYLALEIGIDYKLK
jgi:hypothetical protein